MVEAERKKEEDIEKAMQERDLLERAQMDWTVLAQVFEQQQPFTFYNETFYLWNSKKKQYEPSSEKHVTNKLLELSILKKNNTVHNRKQQILCSFSLHALDGRNVNVLDKNNIQFADKIYNLTTQKIREATKKDFIPNIIPHTISTSNKGEKILALLKEWTDDEKQSRTLLEILAYATYRGYPIHHAFVLIGSGKNGKSTYLDLAKRFVGLYNTTSSNLHKLEDKDFEAAKLYQKNLCIIGETSRVDLKSIQTLKNLTGEDLVSFEKKHRDAFVDQSFAKIVIATNAPPILEDQSDGSLRRFIVIRFPHQFNGDKNPLDELTPEDYEGLAYQCTKILPELITRRKLSFTPSIDEQRRIYNDASNPLPQFIREQCIREEEFMDGQEHKCTLNEFVMHYSVWSQRNKQTLLLRKEIIELLTKEGYVIERTAYYDKITNTSKGYLNCIFGLELKKGLATFTNKAGDVVRSNIAPAPTKNELLEKIRLLYEANTEGIRITELLDMFPGHPEIETYIEEFKKNGDVCEISPGIIVLLQ